MRPFLKLLSNTAKKKIYNIKFGICFFFALIASSGVILYGYEFANLIQIKLKYLVVTIGLLSASCSMLANIILGTYSLLIIKKNKTDDINWIIMLVSLIGSVPYGFLCFFSYQKTLPIIVNTTLSCIVFIVNAGIGYTALKKVYEGVSNYAGKKKLRDKVGLSEKGVRLLGIFIGAIISTTMYLATCHGLTDLFNKFGFHQLVDMQVGYYLAIVSWIPVAALFANGNQAVAYNLYSAIVNFKKTISSTKISDISLIVFCLFSGTAIYSMMHDAYDSTKIIPDFFKLDMIQALVNNYLLPIALLSSGAINFNAIQNIKAYLKDEKN